MSPFGLLGVISLESIPITSGCNVSKQSLMVFVLLPRIDLPVISIREQIDRCLADR